MTDRIAKLAGIGAALALTAALPALAQSGTDALTAWDADGDGVVSETEFENNLGALFGIMDADQNEELSEDEYAAAGQANFDADRNGEMSDEEQALMDDGWTANFGQWDADESGALTSDEYAGGAFGRYDADDSGDLSADEMASYMEETGQATSMQ